MMDAANVISLATKKIVDELSQDYEVSGARMYEILGKDNPYPKAKRLIRQIAHHNQDGARLIKADLDAMFAVILDAVEEPCLEDIHKECFEAVDAILRDKPMATQKTELLELLDICQRKLEGIERQRLKAVRT